MTTVRGRLDLVEFHEAEARDDQHRHGQHQDHSLRHGFLSVTNKKSCNSHLIKVEFPACPFRRQWCKAVADRNADSLRRGPVKLLAPFHQYL